MSHVNEGNFKPLSQRIGSSELQGGTLATLYTLEEQQEKDRLVREGRQELHLLKKKSAELLKVRELLDKQEHESRQRRQL